MEGRRDRIQTLSRLNRRRLELPSFLASLSEALCEPVDKASLVPLSDTDTLFEVLNAGYQSVVADSSLSYRRFFSTDQEKMVFGLADCLADRISNEAVFLFAKTSHECSAVEVKASTLLRHARAIIAFDGDSLRALSKDREQGLLIDHNQGEFEEAYEVVVWGDRWSLLVLGCKTS